MGIQAKNGLLVTGVVVGVAMMIGACSDDEVSTTPTPTTSVGGSGGAAGCPAGLEDCNGVCVETDYDPANCGSCNNACPAGEICSLGQCGLQCLGGTTECSGLCVDTNFDPNHCGGCGNPCQANEVCSQGQCGLQCLGGTTECDGLCVDTLLDPGNCGGCADDPNAGDNICAQGEVCSAGQCQLDCVGGSTECNGLCVDTQLDPGNCGGCANDPNMGDHICVQDEVCSAGQCQLGCVGGTTECNSVCVDTSTDAGNCGGCANDPNMGDHICQLGEICVNSACELSCAPPTEDCNGVCVNTQYDPANCGGCGAPCDADEACVGGICQPLVVCEFNTANLPLQVHTSNYCGDIAFDRDCNLIVSGCASPDVYLVDKDSGAVSTLVTMAQNTRGVVYRRSDDTIYLTDYDEVFSFDGGPTMLVNLGSYNTSITVAPAGWGAYGDQLIVPQDDGEVYAVDPSGPSSTLIGSTSGELPDAAFAPDGTLYLVNDGIDAVQTMTSSGTFATFASGIPNPDGIVVDHDGSRLFVASWDDQVYQVTIPGAVVTVLGAATFDNGWAVSGLALDASGDLLMKVQCSGGGACIDFMTP